MQYSKRVQKDIKQQLSSKHRCDIRIDKEIDQFCEEYRYWFENEKIAGHKPVTIIAEGDSWFRYIIGKAIIYYLERALDTPILNLAYPGDEAREMLSIKQKQRLVRELKRGPAKRKKYDYLLFSGGGNDLVGVDRFHKWIHHYKKGMQAKDLINIKALNSAFSLLEYSYAELIDIRNTHSKKTKILVHSYDFAIPNGKGVCGLGPWMKPGLALRKVPVKLHREVVRLFLKYFDNFLNRIAAENILFHVVKTQGTLVDTDWSNELHPKNSGFKKIAQRFKDKIVHES